MASVEPLIAIVGPTASGKSALGMELAKKFNGEIICADSRTVYKGLDIGTAKPSHNDQKEIKHHLLDVVNPDESFNASDFKKLAHDAIVDIFGHGKLPILVGGSGLYIDALLFDYQFSEPNSPRDPINSRHVDKEVKAIKSLLRENTLVIGVSIERDELKNRITNRVEQMVNDGFIEEVRRINKQYPGSKSLDAPGYKAFVKYLNGEVSLESAKDLFVKNDKRLAKRQMTWFRRNKSIQWVEEQGQAEGLVADFLDNYR